MSVSVAIAAWKIPIRLLEIENPPKYGEQPFARLVDNAFNGATLSLSNRLRLLEEADTRKIRRGDALDVITTVRKRREKALAITPSSAIQVFVKRYAAFVAGYLALAIAWCAFAMSMH